jgi:hypothetical protein
VGLGVELVSWIEVEGVVKGGPKVGVWLEIEDLIDVGVRVEVEVDAWVVDVFERDVLLLIVTKN